MTYRHKHDPGRVIKDALGVVHTVKNFAELARTLGVPRKTLERYIREVAPTGEDETVFEAFLKYAAAVDIDTEELSAEHELRFYKARTKALEKKIANAETLSQVFLDVAAMLRSKPVPVPKPPKVSKDKSHHIAMLHAADWHFGAWERHLGVIPGYNIDIACKAIDATFARSVSLLNKLGYIEIDALVVNFLGDIVENIIMREGQRRLTQLPVAEQVVTVAYRIAQNIRMAASVFPEVHVGGVSGNHGRVTRKPGVSDPWDSFDWLVYKFVEALLSNQPNVHFKFPRTWYIFYVLYGKHVVYAMHGAQIRSYVGFPWYGFGRAASNIAGMMTEEVKARIQQAEFTNTALTVDELMRLLQLIPDTVVIGHFHQDAEFRLHGINAIAANAIIPSTEYIAQSKFAMTRPSQTLSLFSKTRGRYVTSYPIWLDDIVRLEQPELDFTDPIMRIG